MTTDKPCRPREEWPGVEWFGVLVVYSWPAAMMALVSFVLFYCFNAAAGLEKAQSQEQAQSRIAAPGTATSQRMHR